MFGSLFSTVAVLGLAVSAAVDAAQQPFSVGTNAFASYDAGLFRPMEDMELLSTSAFTTLSHPFFPKYNVRIKKSDFCDGTVKSALLPL